MRSLVIDDEFVALSKLVALLEPLGRCDAATCGRQALELLAGALSGGTPYHLITIDIRMPDIDGLLLLARILEGERLYGAPRARKLIITAGGTSANVRAAAAAGCDGFLVKPVRRAVMLAKLANLGLVSGAAATGRTTSWM